MGQNAAFGSTPRFGFASISAANTARDGTGTLVDVIQGVAAGTIVPKIVVKSTGQPANCVVLLWYFDGTTNVLFDEILISGTPAAGSTTAVAFRTERDYPALVVAGSTHKIKATITVVPTSGAVVVETSGAADLT